MTKIDIFSGFLGAGKTTLIKKLLKEALSGEQVVLIENEFGEIGIDGGFLKEAGIQIREMNSGCICCSLVGDFGTALREVISTYHPDRILIEPSGVGKLSDVVKAVEQVTGEGTAVLNSTVTMVDVTKCKMYMRNFGEFFNNQIQCAGTIILSRTDKADEGKVTQAVKLLREVNQTSPIVTTPIAQLDGKKMMETIEGVKPLAESMMEEACPVCGGHHDHEHSEACSGHHDHEHDGDCGHDHHHHHADEVFSSWGQETVRAYSREELEAVLKALGESEDYGTVLRAKGMVAGKDGQWIYFDMVPGETDIRSGAAEFTGRLCVIGSHLKEDRLAELFGLGKTAGSADQKG